MSQTVFSGRKFNLTFKQKRSAEQTATFSDDNRGLYCLLLSMYAFQHWKAKTTVLLYSPLKHGSSLNFDYFVKICFVNIWTKSSEKSGFTCKYSLIIYALVTLCCQSNSLEGVNLVFLTICNIPQTNQCHTIREKLMHGHAFFSDHFCQF